jgi:hypothetical protein
VILEEQPLCIIRKSPSDLTDQDVKVAFRQLPPSQLAQLKLLRDNGSNKFTSFRQLYMQNCFGFHDSDNPDGIFVASGFFILRSRFNHSCLPNSSSPTAADVDDGLVLTATRDIPAGDEITFCYHGDFEGKTRLERQECLDLGPGCDCKACRPGTTFQRASDMRQRLIRGLLYMIEGADTDGSKSGWLITDSNLRETAENFEIPVSSRIVYNHFIAFLLEEEGLMDDFMLEGISTNMGAGKFLVNQSNEAILRSAAAQDT